MITQKNTALLHRKEFQMMTPAPTATAAGAFVVAPDSGNFNLALYVASATVHYLYSHDDDGFVQIPSGALAGLFGAGACGVYHSWSQNYTANGGTSTSVTVAAATHNISVLAVGQAIEFVSAGTASGFRSTVSSMINNAGTGTITINFNTSAPTTILSTHTFRLTTGRFYVMNAGTIAAGIFRVYDVATLTWTSLGTTNLPATWATDGKLVIAYNYGEIFATGTATAGAATTLTNSAKNWTVNQWTSYQIRITAGTGMGQTRTIASNTATIITVGTAWTTTPDATSVYAIEANEDYLYLLGNAAVTMYRYSISGNTWTVMAPTVARAAVPSTGMSASSVGNTNDVLWEDENNILEGRYIYSFRGGASAVIDRFDIAGGTAGAGAWATVTYVGTETFTTGSSAFVMGKWIYIRQNATNRFFKYSVTDNVIVPFTTDLYPDAAAVLGNKIWVKNLVGSNISWVYALSNSGIPLRRVMNISN